MVHSKEECEILKASWELAYRLDLLGVSYFNETKSYLNQSEKNFTYTKSDYSLKDIKAEDSSRLSRLPDLLLNLVQSEEI